MSRLSRQLILDPLLAISTLPYEVYYVNICPVSGVSGHQSNWIASILEPKEGQAREITCADAVSALVCLLQIGANQ